MKKIVSLLTVMLFLLSTIAAFAAEPKYLDQPTVKQPEKTKDRLSRGMNNLLYGTVESADNINQTNTKGTQLEKCNKKTRSGVERGIARVFTGVWQLATFWYSDPGCVTKSAQAAPTAGTAFKQTAAAASPEIK